MTTPEQSKQLQSQDELSQHLQEQLEFLQRSADSFDQGFEAEAKRLAVTIRVLVHETRHSKSLLDQLNQKSIQFVDSAVPETPGNLQTHSGLTVMVVSPSNGSSFAAPLDETYNGRIQTTDFQNWWEATVINDANGTTLSRKALVLSMADQDGGAHVDPSLNSAYAELSRNNSLGWISSDGITTQPMGGSERAAIRQIAHELLKSIIPDYSKAPVYPPNSMISAEEVVTSGADTEARIAYLKTLKRKL